MQYIPALSSSPFTFLNTTFILTNKNMMENSFIVKKKRTKRQRRPNSSISAKFSEMITSDQKEEVANCLLLLAQSCHKPADQCIKPKAKARMHKCLICGKEFNSGQALGGHMGLHRIAKQKNSKGFLLDLNLPPPCDDDIACEGAN